MNELDLAQIEQAQIELRESERAVVAELEARNLLHVWEMVRVGLKCEEFFETKLGKELVRRLNEIIAKGQQSWLLAANARDPEVVRMHLEARAAHMAILMIDNILHEAEDAEAQLKALERDDNER